MFIIVQRDIFSFLKEHIYLRVINIMLNLKYMAASLLPAYPRRPPATEVHPPTCFVWYSFFLKGREDRK